MIAFQEMAILPQTGLLQSGSI